MVCIWIFLVLVLLYFILTRRCYDSYEGGGDNDESSVIFRMIQDIVENVPIRTYAPKTQNKAIKFNGQRKLILALVDFVEYVGVSDGTLLYVGGAPGDIVVDLAKLYPKLTIHIYDPKPFNIAETEQIKLFQREFGSEEDIVLYKNISNVLLFSDIRTANEDTDLYHKVNLPNSTFEDHVYYDLELQKKWVEQIDPLHSSLKFRFPYNKSSVSYFDGVQRLQAWFRPMSTETRLIVNRDSLQKTYNLSIYENIMFTYNMNFRPSNDYQIENELCATKKMLKHILNKSIYRLQWRN